MSCNTSKSCHSKWCAWLQALAQVAVAGVIVYAGFIVNMHMESWTKSFERGSEDLHSIRQDMGNIAYSMESINNDMEEIKTKMSDMTQVGLMMNDHVDVMNNEINILNQQIDYMNRIVGGMRRNMKPGNIMRNVMPF